MKAEGGEVYEGDAWNYYEITEKSTQNINMCGTIQGCGTIKFYSTKNVVCTWIVPYCDTNQGCAINRGNMVLPDTVIIYNMNNLPWCYCEDFEWLCDALLQFPAITKIWKKSCFSFNVLPRFSIWFISSMTQLSSSHSGVVITPCCCVHKHILLIINYQHSW